MAGHSPTNETTETRDAFFTRIVHQHGRLLYRVAHSVLRNPADAEDAVADALLKLLRSTAWQTITNEKAFLTRTVWRAALDRLDARPNATNLTLDDIQPEDPHFSPEHSALLASDHALLHTLIDQLPADLREPLLLSAIEEMNSREIGLVMDLPEATVRTRLMRARRQLQAHFQALQATVRGREVAARGPGQ